MTRHIRDYVVGKTSECRSDLPRTQCSDSEFLRTEYAPPCNVMKATPLNKRYHAGPKSDSATQSTKLTLDKRGSSLASDALYFWQLDAKN